MIKRILLFLLVSQSVVAQQTAVYTDHGKIFHSALELFNKQKYGAAQKDFDSVATDVNASEHARSLSEYYAALCAVELFNKDAEYRLLQFLEHNPGSPKYDDARFDLAKFYYQQKRWKKSIEWFEKIDVSRLSEPAKEEYYFKLGYAYYMDNDYDKSAKAFFYVKDTDSKYASAAQYYYAHMMYVNKNYETALKAFIKLQESEAFAPVAPYYITQILYLQGKYDEVLKYAPPMMDSASTRNAMEIGRMIGESYYHRGMYKEALPYISDYEKNSGAATRLDYYQLGYIHYKLNECDKAIPYFKRAIESEDSLSQFAYYQLADCFLRTNNKQAARTAFQSAAKLNYDATIKEESKFNFAKLSYELNVQSAAIDAFKDYLTSYPQGVHVQESNELLISMYASTKNYRDALEAMDKIQRPSEGIKGTYQKIAYYRGVELFMDNNMKDAITLFNTAIKNPSDPKLTAAAYYWRGEAQYKLNSYSDALSSYNDFLFSPAALRLDFYNLANYNAGYACFKKEDYNTAQSFFRKYIKEKSQTDKNRYNDALLRIADCFFVLKNYTEAQDYYTQAIDNKSSSSDYALYQKALIFGLQNRTSEKISTLQKLFSSYPKSVYFDDALYEAANASMLIGNNEQALKWYRKIISDYPTSSYVKKAMLGEALVYYNLRQDDAAKTAYMNVVEKYPNTPESKEALAQLKIIAVSQNKTDEYFEYARSKQGADVSAASQDSAVYEAAEIVYSKGNCDEAIKNFDRYLDKYPSGAFRTNATYYKADCQYRNKLYETALGGFEFVLSQPKNTFTENSLLNAASILFRLKQYDKALSRYEELEQSAEVKENIIEAQVGQMRAAYRIQQYDKAMANADKVLANATDKNLQNEAHLIKGRSALVKDDLNTAKAEFKIVAQRTNSEMTAEANYSLALIEYKLANFKDSKDMIFKIQKQNPSYDYWVAKGFILLGDNYLAQKDTFQARITYTSIVDNYKKNPNDPDDLKLIAQQKLDNLIADKNRQKEIMEKKLNEMPEDTLK